MTPIAIPQDHLVFEVVVFYHQPTSGSSADLCEEGIGRSGEGEEVNPIEPEIHVVSFGLFSALTRELAKKAAARAAGYASGAEWSRQLEYESDVPMTLDAVRRPFHHLEEDEWSRITVLLGERRTSFL